MRSKNNPTIEQSNNSTTEHLNKRSPIPSYFKIPCSNAQMLKCSYFKIPCSIVQLFKRSPIPSYFKIPCSNVQMFNCSPVLTFRVKMRIFTLIELLIINTCQIYIYSKG